MTVSIPRRARSAATTGSKRQPTVASANASVSRCHPLLGGVGSQLIFAQCNLIRRRLEALVGNPAPVGLFQLVLPR